MNVRQQVSALASTLSDYFGEIVLQERPGRCTLVAVEFGPRFGEKTWFVPIGIFHSWHDALDWLRWVHSELQTIGDAALLWCFDEAGDGTMVADFAVSSGTYEDDD